VHHDKNILVLTYEEKYFQSKKIDVLLEIPKLLEVIPGFQHEID
jgi:hypothetical protein